MIPRGGSEILYNNLLKYVGDDWKTRVNLILSFVDDKLLTEEKINVIWQHLYVDQFATHGMDLKETVDKIDHCVYVSDWQKENFIKYYKYATHIDNIVIKNAIEPMEFKEKTKDKIQLIYTSMPDRGLEVLLEAWRIMNRNDVELIVYSSNIIYGKNYSDARYGLYDKLFSICKTTKNIHYRGYGLNQAVRRALQSAHIFAYPSIFPETSCLAAIEAGAAGCKIVTTNLAALPETCGSWATYVPITDQINKLAESYAEVLNKAIDNYHSESYNIKNQSDWFNDYYSWNRRAEQWRGFFKTICER